MRKLLWLLFLWPTLAMGAQFTGSGTARRVISGTSLPAVCSVDNIFFKTDATAGENIYLCTSANTWTQVTGSGGTTAAADVTVDSTSLVGVGTDAQAVFEELDNGIADHLADTTDAHDASAISVDSTSLPGTATDVQSALADACMVTSGAGAPSAGTVVGACHIYIDTSTTPDEIYFGKGTGSNFIHFGDMGDAINEVCFDADCETASGSATSKFTSTSGDISGTVSQAAGVITTDLSAAAKLKTKNIVFRVGSTATGAAALADTDDESNFYQNELAAMTITQVKCWTNTGTSTINIQRDDGSAANVLSSNVTCSTAGVTGTINTDEDNLAVGDKLNFVMVTAAASGTPTMVTVNIKATLD